VLFVFFPPLALFSIVACSGFALGSRFIAASPSHRIAMSDIFEGYERQYCELSANLSRKCTSVAALYGGELSLLASRAFILLNSLLYSALAIVPSYGS
jgi:hypothetical protein